VKLRNIYVTKM